jgi:hypothetical protein
MLDTKNIISKGTIVRPVGSSRKHQSIKPSSPLAMKLALGKGINMSLYKLGKRWLNKA